MENYSTIQKVWTMKCQKPLVQIYTNKKHLLKEDFKMKKKILTMIIIFLAIIKTQIIIKIYKILIILCKNKKWGLIMSLPYKKKDQVNLMKKKNLNLINKNKTNNKNLPYLNFHVWKHSIQKNTT